MPTVIDNRRIIPISSITATPIDLDSVTQPTDVPSTTDPVTETVMNVNVDHEDLLPLCEEPADSIPTVSIISPSIPSDTFIHQYGNDYGLENDPVPLGSRRKLKAHVPSPVPAYLLEPDFFVVDKVINHKGTHLRPNSMK